MEIVEMMSKSKNKIVDIRNTSNESLQRYCQWLDEGKDLPNGHIEIECTWSSGNNFDLHEIDMHPEPRSLGIVLVFSPRP